MPVDSMISRAPRRLWHRGASAPPNNVALPSSIGPLGLRRELSNMKDRWAGMAAANGCTTRPMPIVDHPVEEDALIIGYGSRGPRSALNLEGVGRRRASASATARRRRRRRERRPQGHVGGRRLVEADVVMILAPDTEQKSIYGEHIAAGLDRQRSRSPEASDVRFGRIIARGRRHHDRPEGGPGHLVRRTYTEGGGMPRSPVEQDATGNAGDRLVVRRGDRQRRAEVWIRATFPEDETIFGEQVVLCGWPHPPRAGGLNARRPVTAPEWRTGVLLTRSS